MPSLVVYLCGPPSCGKSSTSQLMSKNQWCSEVASPGSWLRHIMASHDLENPLPSHDLPNYLHNNWNNECLDPIVEEYVEQLLAKHVSGTVVIEGYPRTVAQLLQCQQWAYRCPTIIVNLQLPLAVLQKRAAKRKRDGDNEQTLVLRYEHYVNLLKVFLSKDTHGLIHTLALSGNETAEGVYEKVLECSRLAKKIGSDDEGPLVLLADHQQTLPPSAHFEHCSAIQRATIIQMQHRLSNCNKRKRQFCGTHPVSLDRENMPRLLRFPYMCALKIDGQRLFCMVFQKRFWFVNRRLEVWRSRQMFEELVSFDNTLLDGELCNGGNVFVILDVLCVRGRHVHARPIMERIAHGVEIARFFYDKPLAFRVQEYVDRIQLQQLMERAARSPYPLDGVIFQPSRLPYRCGSIDYNLFKWKPAQSNTVDLLWGEDSLLYMRKAVNIHNPTEQAEQGTMLVEAPCKPNVHDFVRFPSLKPGVVVECGPSLDQETNELVWVPRNLRPDKLFPNMDFVVKNVCSSIEDNISETDLVIFCQRPAVHPTLVPNPPKPLKKNFIDT